MNLNALDEQIAELSAGHRSRETTNVKSKLSTLRKQWEALRQKARAEEEMVSGQVGKWHQFQHAMGQLEEWLDKSEKYLAEPAGTGTSLADIKDQLAKHAVRLVEYTI